uniref:Nuclear transcription factor Y subunit n=1 Tax=Macrostomum lignano TaxID=282301 RepID=A0A1I8JR66_9PLAT
SPAQHPSLHYNPHPTCPQQPEPAGGHANIQEHIMTWPPYRMGNRSHIVLRSQARLQHYKVGENLRRRKCNFWNAQMRKHSHYMRKQNVPCITDPKKSTQNIFWRSRATARVSSVILVGLATVFAAVFCLL